MRRGDVVEVDWVYTDMSGSKVRPAVVVQGDFLNHLKSFEESGICPMKQWRRSKNVCGR